MLCGVDHGIESLSPLPMLSPLSMPQRMREVSRWRELGQGFARLPPPKLVVRKGLCSANKIPKRVEAAVGSGVVHAP